MSAHWVHGDLALGVLGEDFEGGDSVQAVLWVITYFEELADYVEGFLVLGGWKVLFILYGGCAFDLELLGTLNVDGLMEGPLMSYATGSCTWDGSREVQGRRSWTTDWPLARACEALASRAASCARASSGSSSRARPSWWLLILMTAWQAVEAVRDTSRPPPLKTRGSLAWQNAPSDQLSFNNRLAIHAVDDKTNVAYERAVREFLIDAKRVGVPFETVQQRDKALAAFLADQCYVRNQGYSKGSVLFNGFMHIFEDHRNFLPLSARALKAWERQQQGQEGQPIPLQGLALVILDLCEAGLVYEACAVVIQLDGWLREQDWAQLRRSSVSTDASGRVALLLGDRMRGEKVKTGSGQGVELETELAKAIMRCLTRDLGSDDLVFPITPDKYRRSWSAALSRIGYDDFGPPHAIRHTGAAHYVANGGDLETARRRGRWTTASALQRYTKTHVLVQRRAMMKEKDIHLGEKFWQAPGAAMAAALEKSKAARRPLAARLIVELEALSGDAVPLGVAGVTPRVEAGRPKTGAKALHRRRS